jgi:protein-disulfide isomerase
VQDLRSAPLPDLRSDDHVRGPAGAPLVVMYGDYTCPHCATAHARLAEHDVRLVFRHFALKAKHPRSVALASAAEAASLQDAFWPFHDALYADRAHLDDPHLWARAEALGLDVERLDADRRSDAVAARVRRDVKEGMRAGVMATPTLFLPGGERIEGAPPLDWAVRLSPGPAGAGLPN